MGSPKSLRQILLQTGLAWVANLNDPEGAFSIGRTTDAVHTILPASLDVTPRMSNTAMTEFLVSSLPGLYNYSTIKVGDMLTIIDERQRKIIMHLKGSGQTERGRYENEYLWILSTNDDGKLIKESFEYIDSYLFTEFSS